MEIDVIIPLYRPGKELFTLLDRLQSQTVPIGKIILMNTITSQARTATIPIMKAETAKKTMTLL